LFRLDVFFNAGEALQKHPKIDVTDFFDGTMLRSTRPCVWNGPAPARFAADRERQDQKDQGYCDSALAERVPGPFPEARKLTAS
jgi:hypothetical protein